MKNTKETIRELAKQVRGIAESDMMRERVKLWQGHYSLKKVRPPVLCRVGGGFLSKFWEERGERVVSTDPIERQIEAFLRRKLMKMEIGDDEIVESKITVPAVLEFEKSDSGDLLDSLSKTWGVPIKVKITEKFRKGEEAGSYEFDPPIREESDIEKLKVGDCRVNEAATRGRESKVRELLGDILDIQIEKQHNSLLYADIAYHAVFLRGLNQLMVDMVERPEWTHRFMSFIGNAKLEYGKMAEEAGYLSIPTAPVSGFPHLCDDLPQSDFNPGHVRKIDMWGCGDSQEFTCVSPEMMDEFLFQYQLPIMDYFGLNIYGCCESFHKKWHLLKKIPRLRKFAVSRWTKLEEAVEEMGPGYVMNWRVNSMDVQLRFDENGIRKEIENGLRIAGACPIEVILQDIEIVSGGMNQLRDWARIAREVAEN